MSFFYYSYPGHTPAKKPVCRRSLFHVREDRAEKRKRPTTKTTTTTIYLVLLVVHLGERKKLSDLNSYG